MCYPLIVLCKCCMDAHTVVSALPYVCYPLIARAARAVMALSKLSGDEAGITFDVRRETPSVPAPSPG